MTMTKTEYRYILAGLCLTQGDAAAMLDLSLRTSNSYANGKPIPETVAQCLRRNAQDHGLLDYSQGRRNV